jgi:osmotically inducible lipoprotein OsmB
MGTDMTPTRTMALLAVTATFFFGGCAGMSRQEVSTVTGAAVGAVAGSAVGGPAATAGGAVIGGVIGHELGKK